MGAHGFSPVTLQRNRGARSCKNLGCLGYFIDRWIQRALREGLGDVCSGSYVSGFTEHSKGIRSSGFPGGYTKYGGLVLFKVNTSEGGLAIAKRPEQKDDYCNCVMPGFCRFGPFHVEGHTYNRPPVHYPSTTSKSGRPHVGLPIVVRGDYHRNSFLAGAAFSVVLLLLGVLLVRVDVLESWLGRQVSAVEVEFVATLTFSWELLSTVGLLASIAVFVFSAALGSSDAYRDLSTDAVRARTLTSTYVQRTVSRVTSVTVPEIIHAPESRGPSIPGRSRAV